MLSAEDNALLTHVEAGTPMGDMIREFWIPAIRYDEMPEPDGAPLRIRLLCENLIAFRVTSGRVGVIQGVCAHRGASLFFARNEEEGLRCIYHGWKYDVDGNCVDMPAELPENAGFKDKVKALTYPTAERNGIIWVYMGPRETPPPLPDLEPNVVGGEISTQMTDCNWLQAVENNMDTAHIGFLHFGAVDPTRRPIGWTAGTGSGGCSKIARRDSWSRTCPPARRTRPTAMRATTTTTTGS